MSYRDRRESHGRSRDRHDSRRSEASSSRRSRSPSPPELHKDIPRAFGRIPETAKDKDDDSNVLQRMTKKFTNAPLGSLTKCLEGNRKIKVWTRNFKEVRGICTGYVVAFDKHWNLVMCDVDEVYLKRKKHKTPCFEDLASAENFSELPEKTPKEKKKPASVDAEDAQPPPPEVEKEAEGVAGAKKKKKRIKKKKGSAPHKRHVKQLFVRGDSIVMAAILEPDDGPD